MGNKDAGQRFWTVSAPAWACVALACAAACSHAGPAPRHVERLATALPSGPRARPRQSAAEVPLAGATAFAARTLAGRAFAAVLASQRPAALLPGAVLCVVKGPQILLLAGDGVARLPAASEHAPPLTPKTPLPFLAGAALPPACSAASAAGKAAFRSAPQGHLVAPRQGRVTALSPSGPTAQLRLCAGTDWAVWLKQRLSECPPLCAAQRERPLPLAMAMAPGFAAHGVLDCRRRLAYLLLVNAGHGGPTSAAASAAQAAPPAATVQPDEASGAAAPAGRPVPPGPPGAPAAGLDPLLVPFAAALAQAAEDYVPLPLAAGHCATDSAR